VSTAAERIKAAAAATAAAETAIAAVAAALAVRRPVNSRGVYVDRHNVVADFGAAKYAIERALNAIQGGEWPSAADYKDGDAP
jgi:hypothetical protein